MPVVRIPRIITSPITRREQTTLDSGQAPCVSILVRVKNERHALPLFWERLRKQTLFERTESIFLDSGSTDGTLEYLREQPCKLYALEEEFNFGRSCNQIAALATTPVLVFLSGHVLLEQQCALEEVVCLLNQHPDGAAYLRQIPNWILGYSKYEAAYLARRFPHGTQNVRLNGPAAFSNAASAMARVAWERQPFQEIHGSEDFLWAKQHLERGGKMFYLPQLQVLHSHSEGPDQVYARVHTNAKARQQTENPMKAAYLFAGIYLSMRRVGARHAEALQFASAHAKAYL